LGLGPTPTPNPNPTPTPKNIKYNFLIKKKINFIK